MDRKSVSAFRETPKSGLSIILDNVRSAHNVGAIFRTADAFVATKMHLCGYTPRPPHTEIAKTALGATESVSWQAHNDVSDCLDSLHSDHSIIGLEITRNAIQLEDFSWPQGPIAVVLGNEVTGLSATAMASCHQFVSIPQFGTKHSLNVAVSAALFIWEHYTTKKGGDSSAL